MPRKPVVSKTVRITKAKILAVNVEEESMQEKVVTVNGFFKSNDDLLKQIKKEFEGIYVPIKIVESHQELERYQMPLDDFKSFACLIGNVKSEDEK